MYEIAERFTAGEIDRLTLVDQLSRWPVTAGERPQPEDNRAEVLPDVGKALRHGLLDEAAYQAVLEQRRAVGRSSRSRSAPATSGE